MGVEIGSRDGGMLGLAEGGKLGLRVGAVVGCRLGCGVSYSARSDGARDRFAVGAIDGPSKDTADGDCVGEKEGGALGSMLGPTGGGAAGAGVEGATVLHSFIRFDTRWITPVFPQSESQPDPTWITVHSITKHEESNRRAF